MFSSIPEYYVKSLCAYVWQEPTEGRMLLVMKPSRLYSWQIVIAYIYIEKIKTYT